MLGRLDPDADPRVLPGLIVTTQRGLEALFKGGIDADTPNGVATATIDSIAFGWVRQ